MLKISKEGGIIYHVMVAYYNKPETLKDNENFIVGKLRLIAN